MSEKKFPIGIDLGTVNSVVAVYRKNKPEIIKCQGNRITPSTVFYYSDDNKITVGDIEELWQNVGTRTYDYIYDSKRFIGRSFHDEYIQKFRNNFGFDIAPTNSNGIHIPVTQNGKLVHLTPQQVSSEILKVLKQSAEDYLGYEVKEAVITVPAYFTFSQRNATKKAAKLAGLDVLMLLNEPTAAYLHHTKEQEQNQENTLSLVFDLGGGTLDISIVRISKNGIKVVAVDGDTWLGGRNFDEVVLEHIIKENNLTLNKKNRERLVKAIEEIKCKLSYREEHSKNISSLIGRSDFKLSLTRKKFEAINETLFEKCLSIIKRCLEKSNTQKEDIDKIILVGGSTKIPKIRELIQDFFGKPASADIDPDEAVACGAAIQASSMKKLVTSQLKIVDVTPFSIGFDVLFDQMYKVIKCNTPIPTENTVSTVTVNNYQTKSDFNVYEGERERCKLNNLIGKYTLKNIPKKPAGQVRTITTFSIDESGLLKISAKEESSGISTELEIGVELLDLKNNNKTSLDSTKEDIRFLQFVLKLNELRDPCVQFICDKNDHDIDVTKCKKFINDLQDLEFEDSDKLENLVENFKEKLSDETLIQEICNINLHEM